MKAKSAYNLKVFLDKWLHIAIGCFVTAGGVMMLKHASVVTGGTAGLALTLSHLFPVPFHFAFMLLNLPFFLFSYFYMGRTFTLKTVAAISMLSALSAVDGWLPDFAIPPLAGSVVGGAFIGVGIAALFRSGASLGGATIIAVYLQKRHGLNPGQTNLVFDLLVVLASLSALPLGAGLMSALSIAVTSAVLTFLKRKSGTAPRLSRRKSPSQRQPEPEARIHADLPVKGIS
jgi:uncharacterized membrane-anchored protein YitT (DUF2179 family)